MINDYEVFKKLGKGAFGFVVLARYIPSDSSGLVDERNSPKSSSDSSHIEVGDELVAIKIL